MCAWPRSGWATRDLAGTGPIEPDLLPRLLAADALPRELEDMARRRIT